MEKPKRIPSEGPDSELQKKDFEQYLKVLFPLIEGDSEQEKIREKLETYLAEYGAPAEIEAMLKDLFLTKFHEPF